MNNNISTIQELIVTHADFFSQFGYTPENITSNFEEWQKINSNQSITDYYSELLRKASLYNMKHADNELEFYQKAFELNTRALPLLSNKETKDFMRRQIHLNQLMIAKLTMPLPVDVQLDTKECCPKCAKKHNKLISMDDVLMKPLLPIKNCTREEGCVCSYLIIPRS